MYALNRKIARLEMRAEQLVIHLRSMKRHTRKAEEVRRIVLVMLERLQRYKEQRERLEESGAVAARP